MKRLPKVILSRRAALPTIGFVRLIVGRTRVDDHEGCALGGEVLAGRGDGGKAIAETAGGAGAIGGTEGELVECCVEVAGACSWGGPELCSRGEGVDAACCPLAEFGAEIECCG